MDSKVIKSHQCSLEISYAASVNSKQGLAFFRKKQKNEDFNIHLLNAWIHFTNNSSPTPTSIEEILD